MECKNCNEHQPNVEPIPYIAHEAAMARAERTIKRLFILLIVTVCLWFCSIFATVGGFLWYINQYDFESYEYTQDGEGLNIIGDGNGVDFNVPETESAEKN